MGVQWLLFRLELRQLRNQARQLGLQEYIILLLFFSLGVGFLAFEFYMSYLLIGKIAHHPNLGDLAYVLIDKLLNMLFLTFGGLLAYSTMVAAISSLYLSPDIDLLLSFPIKTSSLLAYRYFRVAVITSYMLILFGSPILISHGLVREASWPYYPAVVLLMALFALLPCALGFFAAVLFMLAFSPRRAQQALTGVGLVLVVGLVLMIRLMRPEQLVDPIGAAVLTNYLTTLKVPAPAWLPATWAARFTEASCSGEWRVSAGYAAALLATGSAAVWFAVRLSVPLFFIGRSGSRRDSLGAGTRTRTLTIGRSYQAWRKDLILLLRDSTQWSQFLILSALVIVYVYNFKQLPYALYQYTSMMSYVSVGATGLILAAVAARFAYPALSLEGPALWLLLHSPLNWRNFLLKKFLFHLAPSLLLGQLLIVFSNRVLSAGSQLRLTGCWSVALLAVGLNGLAVGLGVRYPKFRFRNPAEIPVGYGGMMFMILAVFFIFAVLIVASLPDLLDFFPPWYPLLQRFNGWERLASPLLAGLLTLFATVIPLTLGWRRLRRLESEP